MDDENDEAPLPPETIAASFEDDAKKSALIDEYNGATDREAELPRWETDDDEAPPPPETMAAAFEKQRDEEENQEGNDDDDAPCPPELMAASYEAMDRLIHDIMKNTADLNEDNTNRPVPEGQIASLHEAGESISTMQEIDHLDEDSEGIINSTLFSYQRHSINVEDGLFPVTPSHQGGNDAILAGSSQGHAEIQRLTTEVTMTHPQPNFDPYYQSLPLLEATLVQDLPSEPVYIYVNTNSREDEPVYDAFPLSDTQNDDVHGWSRKNKRAIILGSILVAIAAIITVLVVTVDRQKKQSSLPITTSTTSTTMPITFNVYIDEMNTVSVKPMKLICMITIVFADRMRHLMPSCLLCTISFSSPHPARHP